LFEWGSEGTGPGEVIHLHAVAIDLDDHVYVSDARDNSRISKFTIDGEYITMWGSKGSEPRQFEEHHGIDFDSTGNVYVTDTANQRIQMFTPDGEFVRTWGSEGAANDQFLMPQDIAIDSSDNIYISDVGDAHPEISYIGNFLEENRELTQASCVDTETAR
jgi:DNA-binding beta-propeller fold protein YncE